MTAEHARCSPLSKTLSNCAPGNGPGVRFLGPPAKTVRFAVDSRVGLLALGRSMKRAEFATNDLKALQRLPKPKLRYGLMVSALIISTILIEIGVVMVLLVACWVQD